MPLFNYEIKEQSGQVQEGSLEAESPVAVARELRARGYIVVSIQPARSKKNPNLEHFKRRVLAPVFYPVSSKNRALFFSSLRALLSAGMNVSEAMSTLSQRTNNRLLSYAAAQMAEEAIRGRHMTPVMQKYPAAFPPAALAVMEAGEQSGLVERTTGQLAHYFDRAFELEQIYRWQTFYPKMLLLAFIFIPTAPTLVLGNFSAWLNLLLTRSLPSIFALLIAWYGWRLLLQITPLKRAIDSIRLFIPWFGSLSRRLSTARWARALALLLSAGVPVHRALVAAASTTGNTAMEEALIREAEGVMKGKSVTEVLTASRYLPDMALDMISTAERAGSIEDALEKVADYYESETDVGGKQTAVAVGIIFYLLVAIAIAIYVIGFWRGHFGQFENLIAP